MEFFKKSYWHILAFPISFIYFYFGNTYNFMHLQEMQWQGIKNTQYILQPFMAVFTWFFIAIIVEFIQGMMGANKDQTEWKKNAVPDIKVTVVCGFLGWLLEFVLFELSKLI